MEELSRENQDSTERLHKHENDISNDNDNDSDNDNDNDNNTDKADDTKDKTPTDGVDTRTKLKIIID